MKRTAAFIISLLVVVVVADDIVPDGRLATNQWTEFTGVRGGVPDSSGMTIYTTLALGSTAAQINTALDDCPSNQVIQLEAGTYTMDASLVFDGNRGVVLRGETGVWPPTTILNFTNHSTTTYISVRNPYHEGVGGFTTPDWTANYTRGTETVTLSAVTGLAVGDVIVLDQENDDENGETAYGGEGVSCGTCDPELDGLHVKHQHVLVTGISGNDVTFTPPIFGTNWNRGGAFGPRALYATDQNGGDRCGIENLYITCTNAPTGTRPYRIVNFRWVHDSWIKDCVIEDSENLGVECDNSVFITVQGCKFVNNGYNHGSQAYSVGLFMGSGYLITDNIFNPFTSGIITGGGTEGCVFSYNYFTNSMFEGVSATAIASTVGFHAAYANYHLVEGNWGLRTTGDNIHGSCGYITVLRNRMVGWQTNKTDQSFAVEISGSNYWWNVVGNILGTDGFHDSYEHAGSSPSGTEWVWKLNFWDANTVGSDHYDSNVVDTLIRKGNWNVVDAAIPAAEDLGATAIPNSYYLTSKPVNFGILDWPPYDPENPELDSPLRIPAGYRAYTGENPPLTAGGSNKGRGQLGQAGRFRMR